MKPGPGPGPAPRDDLPIELRRGKAASRCPHCHESFEPDQPISQCSGCGARWHLGCLGEARAAGCGVCGGTVFSEGVAERLTRRRAGEVEEGRVRRLSGQVGLFTFFLTTPLGCAVCALLLVGLGVHDGLGAVVILLVSLAIPVMAASMAAELVRRRETGRSDR